MRNSLPVMAVVVLLFTAGLIWFDRAVLDPGGRGFSGEANDFCRDHGGVKEMNPHQGVVICWDGAAR